MTCACGHENPEGAKFCLECGSSLAHRCAECATELPGGAKFCLECGHPVATVPGAASDAESRHEVRKVVTVVFVDLAGSTSLQEHMDPESVRRVMDRFYTQMRTEIEGAGGLVVKFTGDGVMAGFGIRAAGEDDALRAVHAAARMQEAFAGFAEEIAAERGAEVALRIGVNTGEVVVSGTDDDVVGDVVNVAARLEHAAGDGNILVGEETRRLTRHAVTYAAVAPLELKGKAEPVPAYRLVSLEAPPEEEVAPFVGRTAELARLRNVFETSVASATPGIVTVLGSPGLGKTRLATELAASVSDRARILEARCFAATTTTYAPIAEALREAAGIPETATAEEVVSALEALLPADFPERSRIAKLTASVLGVGDAAAPQETFWATRRLLEGLTAVRPLVLIVDDVQWAEPMLLDLFDHIVEWAKGAAIVIVALARPEIREVRPSLVDAGAIVLEGLDPGDTAALAASLLGAHDLPEALVRRILEATEGNPLFVRELLRMLVDDGVLSRDGDRWTITVEASEIDVPPTIHALLAARIERLHDDERSVVERASVVGKEFYRGAVLDLLPPQVGSGIDAHLETLRRKELVEPEGTYWIDERVFRFHHVLIRDAAYRRLLKEARAELHERFADWLERKVGELVGEHEEVLGYHLEQAHTYRAELGSTDDHTAGLGRRAATHLASATARALDRDDLTAAAQLSARALALTDDEDARASVLFDRCEALLAMGQVGAATGAVTELRAQATDDRLVAWADCFDGQLAVLTDPSRLHDTAATVESAARRLADLGDIAGAAKAHAVHAQALAHLGQFGACEAALDRALAAAREAGDRRRANAVLSAAPLAALWGPNPVPRASGRCLDVVRVLRITAGAPAVEANALRCQAVLEAMRGRTEAAHRMLTSARSTLEELGLRHALVECDLFCGLIDLLSGDATGAEVSLRAAHDGFRALNVGTDTALAAALLARALVDQGRDEEALPLTEESERLGGDDLKTAIAWRTVRARVLARRGEVEPAIELARAAVALAEPTDALVDHADARLALAEVLHAAGRSEEGDAESRQGRELYARKEATPDGDREVDVPTRAASIAPGVPGGGVHAAPGVAADHTVAILDRYLRALLDRDWDAMTEIYTEDLVVVDHRSGLRSEVVGRHNWVDAMRTTWQDTESEWDFEVLGAWSEEVALTRVRSTGQGWERAYVMITVSHEDVVSRTEIFDLDDHPLALARLDELTYERSSARPAIDDYVSGPNEHGWTAVIPITAAGRFALVRTGGSFGVVSTVDGNVSHVELFDGDDEVGARRRLHELAPGPSYVSWLVRHHFDRHTHQDWDALRALNAPNVLVVDHRPVGWGAIEGFDRALEFLQEDARAASMAPGELGITEWLSISPDGALVRFRRATTAPDGVDLDRLLLMRVRSRDGLVVRSYIYNPDQIEDARRLMSGADIFHRAAPGVDADLSLRDQARAAMLARDREAMLALFTPDHVFVDHRGGLQSEVSGPVEFLSGSAATYQGLEFGRTIEILSMWTDDISLSRVTSWGDGWKIGSLFVAVTCDGLWCRTEQFDEDDWEGAFTRLDELSYGSSVAKPAIDRYVSAPNEHGWSAVVGIAASGNGALVRVTDPGSGGSLAVVDTADGRIRGIEPFDLDDELAARRRLHELAPSPSFVSWRVRYQFDRHAHQDWDAFRSLFPRDMTLVDHRPIGWGTVHGIDRILEFLQEGARTASMTPDGLWVTEWLAITESKTLYRYRWAGASPDGVGFGFDRLMLTDLGGGAAEIFDPEQIDMARRAMAGEVVAPTSDAPARTGGVRAGPGVEADRAVVDWTKFRDAMLARDWDDIVQILTPDHVLVDSRSGLRSELRGGPAWAEAMRSMWQEVSADWDVDVLAAWSDEVFLSWVSSFGDGWEREYLAVTAARDDAVYRTELLDEDDHATAFRRLDELSYAKSVAKLAIDLATSARDDPDRLAGAVPIAGSGDAALLRTGDAFAVVRTSSGRFTDVEHFELGDQLSARRRLHQLVPSPSYVAWLVGEYFERHTRHDWEAVREVWATDLTVVDHRPTGHAVPRSVDDVVRWLRQGAEAAPVTPETFRIARWLSITKDAALYRHLWHGTTTDGADFVSDELVLATLRDGVIDRVDVFDPEQVDEAVQRMAATSVQLGPVTGRYAEVFNSRAWDRAREVWAPDYFVVDHRPASFARRDLTAFVEGMKAFVDLAPNVQVDPEPVFTSSSAEVAILHLRGETAQGAAFVLDIGAATRVVDGLGSAAVTFVPEDVEAATRWATDHSIGFEKEDFEALRARTAESHPVVAVVQRIVTLGHRGDWAAVADVLSEDVVYEDHRPLMRTASRGRGPILDAIRYQLHDGGELDIDVVDDRGPDLVLVRVLKRLGTSGDSEIPLLIVYGLDGDGRLSHCCLFEEDALEAARARLDDIAGRAVPSVHTPPGGRFAEFGRRWQEAFEAGAGDELAALYTPGFEVTEHQHHVTLDLEAHLEEMRRAAAHPEAKARVDNIVCLGARHGVSRTTFSFERVDADVVGIAGRDWSFAGASEMGGVSAVRLDDEGRCPRFEWFPPDQLHRALARAEELYIEDEATGEALRGARRRLSFWRMTDAHNDGDWEAFAKSWAPDVVFVDRRQLGWGVTEGRDAVVELIRAIQARSVRHVWSISEVRAIADDGCVCTLPTEGVDRDGARYEQGGVAVATLTDEGVSRVEVFAFEAVDEALLRFAELRREGEPEVVRAVHRVCRMYSDHDWEAFRSAFDEDVAVADHRPASWGIFSGSDHLVGLIRGLVDLVPDASVVCRSIERLSDETCLAIVHMSGTDTNGAVVEMTYHSLFTYHEGRFTRWEQFPIEKRDAAVARFEELALEAEPTTSLSATTPSNAYTRVYRAFHHTLRRGDLEAAEGFQAPDIVLEDRRSGLRDSLAGRAELLRNQSEAINLGYTLDRFEPIATRGDRLALVRILWVLGEDSEIEMLVVGEMDEQDRISALIVFDPDDLYSALAELDARYDVTLPASLVDVRKIGYAVTEAYNSHDWDGLIVHYAPDVTVIDHRPAGWGARRGADDFVTLVRALADLVPDVSLLVSSIDAMTESGMASTVSIIGTDRNGASVELTYIVVWTLREGVIEHYEVFPTEQRGAAVARLEELTAEVDLRTTVERAWEQALSAKNERDIAPEQRAEAERRFRELVEESRSSTSTATTIEWSWDGFIAAMNARDFGKLAELLGPGFRVTDHIYHFELDRDGQLANLQRILVGRSSFRQGQAIVLGGRHSVLELVWTNATGGTVGESVVTTLAVARCDADGRFLVCEFFAENDFLEALERAEELYLEDEATGDDVVWSRNRLESLWRSFRAYNAGDLDAFAEQAPSDFVTIDHRPGSLAEFPTHDAWLSWLRAMPEVALDWRFDIRSVLFERNVVLLEMASAGTNIDGGSFESPLLNVVVPGVRQEIYLPEQRDEAERRFRELVEEPREVAQMDALTTIGRSWYRLMRGFHERDMREVSELYAADVRVRDHVHHLELDREEALRSFEVVMGQPGSFAPGRVFYLGDRHAVGQMTWTGSAGAIGDSVVLNWNVARCGSDGKYLLVESFGESDMVPALERAEEAYLEDEALGKEAVASRSRSALWRAILAYNNGDWDGVTAGFAPDLVTIDHRSTGWGRLEGRDAYLDVIRGLADVAPERRWVVRSVEFEGAIVLLRLDVVGTDENGGLFVLPFVAVQVLSESGAKRQELFAPEQRDEAERRFRELIESD